MRTWQAIRNWIRRSLVQSKGPSFRGICEELEALLDLCCYAASQAVAGSKLIEWELGRLNSNDEMRESLVQEHSDLQMHLESQRTKIETLNTLLNSARKHLVLGQSLTECEASRRTISELLSNEDVRELKQAVEDLKQQSIGSEP